MVCSLSSPSSEREASAELSPHRQRQVFLFFRAHESEWWLGPVVGGTECYARAAGPAPPSLAPPRKPRLRRFLSASAPLRKTAHHLRATGRHSPSAGSDSHIPSMTLAQVPASTPDPASFADAWLTMPNAVALTGGAATPDARARAHTGGAAAPDASRTPGAHSGNTFEMGPGSLVVLLAMGRTRRAAGLPLSGDVGVAEESLKRRSRTRCQQTTSSDRARVQRLAVPGVIQPKDSDMSAMNGYSTLYQKRVERQLRTAGAIRMGGRMKIITGKTFQKVVAIDLRVSPACQQPPCPCTCLIAEAYRTVVRVLEDQAIGSPLVASM